MKPVAFALAVAFATSGAMETFAQSSDVMETFAQSSDVKARNVAATCANCHGTGGVSVGEVPSLAGRPRADIIRLMQEFKSDARPGTVMNQLAKGYTDEQIEALAGWFAAQKAPK